MAVKVVVIDCYNSTTTTATCCSSTTTTRDHHYHHHSSPPPRHHHSSPPPPPLVTTTRGHHHHLSGRLPFVHPRWLVAATSGYPLTKLQGNSKVELQPQASARRSMVVRPGWLARLRFVPCRLPLPRLLSHGLQCRHKECFRQRHHL